MYIYLQLLVDASVLKVCTNVKKNSLLVAGGYRVTCQVELGKSVPSTGDSGAIVYANFLVFAPASRDLRSGKFPKGLQLRRFLCRDQNRNKQNFDQYDTVHINVRNYCLIVVLKRGSCVPKR